MIDLQKAYDHVKWGLSDFVWVKKEALGLGGEGG